MLLLIIKIIRRMIIMNANLRKTTDEKKNCSDELLELYKIISPDCNKLKMN
jgi:hypothetical protein